MSIGGSVQEVTIRGRIFSVAADADTNRKLGGFENEVQMNGDGTIRVVKTRTGWSLTGLQLAIDDDTLDMEFLKEIQDTVNPKEGVNITIKYASGNVYGGKGTVTDAVEATSQNSTATVSLAGGGVLTRQ